MLPEIQKLFEILEEKRLELIKDLKVYSDAQLHFQPSPQRWSMMMVLEHIVTAEIGIRHTHEELQHDPVRNRPQPGKLFDAVMEVFNKDIPVNVPHSSLEPKNLAELEELSKLWEEERLAFRGLIENITASTVDEVMFSHPVAGPLDPVRTLQLALAHFETHRRQIDRLNKDVNR